jgi:hypothetical protein
MSRPARPGAALVRALMAELADDPARAEAKAFAQQAADDAVPDETPELTAPDRRATSPTSGASPSGAVAAGRGSGSRPR